MTADRREIELKLAVPDGALDALRAALAEHAGAASARRRQVDTYFDTEDGALARRGMTLRVRRAGGRFIQTLKADAKAGVVADRSEWEWPVSGPAPDPGVSGPIPLPGGLRPAGRVEIRRSVSLLRVDGAVVEAALDEGEVSSGGARLPVRELELELREGDPAALPRLALRLLARVPFTIESESKADRVARLRLGTGVTAKQPARVAIDSTATAAEALRRIVGNGLDHLLSNRPAALAGDIEGVHQMRVAIRRLRSVLVLFRPVLDAGAIRGFEDELRRIGQVFGRARDWDVFQSEVLPDLAAGRWRDMARGAAEARRQAAHAACVAEIQGPPFTALVLGLTAWVEEPEPRADLGIGRPIGAVADGLLRRLFAKARKRGKGPRRHRPAERHALRKSLKKLRYAAEYMRGLYADKAVRRFLRRRKRVLKVLGAMNDTVAAAGLAAQLAAERADLRASAAVLTDRLAGRRAVAERQLAKRWRAFLGVERFWR